MIPKLAPSRAGKLKPLKAPKKKNEEVDEDDAAVSHGERVARGLYCLNRKIRDLTRLYPSFSFWIRLDAKTSSRYEHSFSGTGWLPDYSKKRERERERNGTDPVSLLAFRDPTNNNNNNRDRSRNRQAKQKAEAAKLKDMQAKAAKGGPLLGGGKPHPLPSSFLP